MIISDERYFAFCAESPDLSFERTSEGEIVIVPPVGGETAFRSVSVTTALGLWARMDGRGKTFGPSVQFLLPDGSGRSPDAAWVSNERLALLSKEQRRQFLRVIPEFVVEVLSPSDRIAAARKKMGFWMANGVELGWLIDGDARRVYIYRGASGTLEPRLVTDAESIAGEGPVEGFVLPLGEIWEGL